MPLNFYLIYIFFSLKCQVTFPAPRNVEYRMLLPSQIFRLGGLEWSLLIYTIATIENHYYY